MVKFPALSFIVSHPKEIQRSDFTCKESIFISSSFMDDVTVLMQVKNITFSVTYTYKPQ